mgnify:CR=1 FL=1
MSKGRPIEIEVAPVRERGLKSCNEYHHERRARRSRKGAWIEIGTFNNVSVNCLRRSRKGAWIEISQYQGHTLGYGSRSRKGAWIEIYFFLSTPFGAVVAPVRERGLKFSLKRGQLIDF